MRSRIWILFAQLRSSANRKVMQYVRCLDERSSQAQHWNSIGKIKQTVDAKGDTYNSTYVLLAAFEIGENVCVTCCRIDLSNPFFPLII